jgi:hypothetical protein
MHNERCMSGSERGCGKPAAVMLYGVHDLLYRTFDSGQDFYTWWPSWIGIAAIFYHGG